MSQNTSTGNEFGLPINDGSSGDTFSENVTSDNTRSGFSLYINSSGNLLTQNEAMRNAEDGFAIKGGSVNNTLKESRACNSGTVDAYQDELSAANAFTNNGFCTTAGF